MSSSLPSTGVVPAATPTTTPSPPFTLDTISVNFLDMMGQFLTALKDVYPECPKLLVAASAFAAKTHNQPHDTMVQLGQKGMATYHAAMAPFYDRCATRDESIILEPIPFLDDLGLRDKWNDNMHANTKDTIWEYITHLNNFACLGKWTRDVIPRKLMNTISQSASQLAADLQENGKSLSDVNIFQVSSNILASVDPQELQQLGASLNDGSIGMDVRTMQSMLGGLLPGGPGTMPLSGGGGNGGIGALLHTFMSSQHPQ